MKEYPRWDEVPEHLKTKTQLGKMGLRLARGQEPVALKTHWKYNVPDYDLYDVAQAVPKRKPSEAQLKVLKKARLIACTCKQCEKTFSNPTSWRAKTSRHNSLDICWACHHGNEQHLEALQEREASESATEWAKKVLEDKGTIILDTETTGLTGDDIVIELAIIDTSGKTLLNTLVALPGNRHQISAGAMRVHGISVNSLSNAEKWPDVREKFLEIASQASRIISYNTDFDHDKLLATDATWEIPDYKEDWEDDSILGWDKSPR